MTSRPLALTAAPLPPGLTPLGSGWLACHPQGAGSALYLLSPEPDPRPAAARLSEVLEQLALDLDALSWLHPEVDVEALPRWSVWRLDDNGGEFRMRGFRCQAAAQRYAQDFAARGHKQTYWVQADGPAP